MAASLRRLDGTYTAYLVPPMVSLVGEIPAAMKRAYRAFIERYPGIPPMAFRAINTNVLAEVGFTIHLLDNRVEITIRVDQINVRVANLVNDDEIRFVADCILLANNISRQIESETIIGPVVINISTWIKVDGGGDGADQILAKTGRPAKPQLPLKSQIGAQSIQFLPRIMFENPTEGWTLMVGAEKSAIQEADLFIARQYAFEAGKRYANFEQQFAFVQASTAGITEWLGIDMAQADGTN